MSSALARPKISLRIRLAAANIEIMPAMVVQDGRVMCAGRLLDGIEHNGFPPRSSP